MTIPATELAGPRETLNERVIKVGDKAAALFDKLVAAQKVLGMRLPVDLLVTKCDHIRGFKSFCGEVPKGMQQNILGWSNPYTLDAAYTTSWLDEAFENLYKNLFQTQIEVIVDGIQVHDSDDFFVFPTEFSTMLEPLRTYTNHLFKQSVYHESLYFRGLYFSGDASQGPATTASSSLDFTVEPSENTLEPALKEETVTTASSEPEKPKRLAFLKDLFEMKIFPEFRLARPTAKIFLWRSRMTWALRSAIAGIALVWSLGMWWGFSELITEKQTLEPLLTEINGQVKSLRVRGPEEDLPFSKMALNLLKGMTNVNTSSLTSIFIPRSWVSDLDDQIRQSMVVAYDKIILKSLYYELEDKVKRTLENSEAIVLEEESPNALPVKFKGIPEVKRLQKTLTDINLLWKNIQLYNELHTSKELTQLGDVVKYLFGFDLPTDFYQNASFYHNALMDVEYKLYDPTISRYLLAIPKVRALTEDLYTRLFDRNVLLAKIQDFSNELETISRKNPKTLSRNGAEHFHLLLTKLEAMENQVAQPEFSWMSKAQLDLGKPFNEMMTAIEMSAFLGADLKYELLETGQERFQDLIARLQRQRTSLTGPLLEQDKGQVFLKMSESVLRIKTALNTFLTHDFMIDQANDKELVTEIAPNDQLLWDEKQLQAAVDLHADFNGFQKQTLPKFPGRLQEQVRRTSRWQLQTSMNHLIAKGQTLKTVREKSAFNRPEDALAIEVRSFKKSAPLLSQLMDIFSDLDFTDSSWELSKLVTKHGYHLLKNVDRMLESEALYEFKDGNFSWWTGLTPASLEAYEALDTRELAYYLSIQRERTKYLAREYAEPLVNFLVNRTIKRGHVEERLVSKRHRILIELDRYDAKRTRNSLTLLERFIQVEMPAINPENCLQKITPADLRAPVKDFFGSNLHRLKTELSRQCKRLAKDEVLKSYSLVQTFFDRRLAGKYPLASPDDDLIVDEADPEDLRKFYYLLDRYLGQGLPLLEKSTKFGHSKDSALEFIYLMEEARSFFAPFLSLEKSELPAYTLEVDFRVNRGAEKRANQVIEWAFETKGESVQDHQLKKEPLEWDLNDPIRLAFRWAKNSPDVPVAAGNWPGVAVEKRNVSFTYDNKWSLIQLLSRHEPGVEDFGPLGDPKPHTLLFRIKTEKQQKEDSGDNDERTPAVREFREARLFVRVVVKSPLTKERVLLPALPNEAPRLKQGLNS